MPLALVTKWFGASRWVPTWRVDVISIPPTPSKATRLTHLILGPSYRAKPGVLTSQFWDRSSTFSASGCAGIGRWYQGYGATLSLVLIGVDASRITRSQRTGTENYSLRVLRQLLTQDQRNAYRLYLGQPLPEGLLP